MSSKKKLISLDDNNSQNVDININKNPNEGRRFEVDAISQKDVNIGLDLLVNPEKQKKQDGYSQPSSPKNDISKPTIDFDKDDDDFDFNNMLSKSNKSQENMEQLMSRMNIDTSSPSTKLSDDTYSHNSRREDDDFNNRDEDKRSRNDDDRRDDNDKDYDRDYDRPRQSSYQDERQEKEETLYQLEKMRRLGVQGIKRFNMSSDLEEMKYELNRIKKERQVESSIKFQRQMLMTFVTGAEYLNDSYNVFNFHLKGWSENVYENINDYDEVFEELHEKYGSKGHVAPELRLLYMVVGSGFMYHLSNSLFKSSPANLTDILKQNPDLMRQFANAAINQMPQEQRQAANMMNNMAQMNRPRTPPVAEVSLPPYAPRPTTSGDTSSHISLNSQNDNRMRGKSIPPPQGLDEILDDLKSSSSYRNDNVSEILSRTDRASSRKRTIFQKPNRSSSSSSTLNL
jgi:hypothetical protein